MGYKYRQGSTPDEVDSSQSNPTMPHVGLSMSDSTKKTAPVDTTQLKGRMGRDAQTSRYNEQVGSDLVNSKGIPNALDKAQVAFTKANSADSRYSARKDTLDMARKGKIPAK